MRSIRYSSESNLEEDVINAITEYAIELVHLDLLTIESEKFLTIVDAFSKYAQAYNLRDGTTVSVLQSLLNFFTHHSVPITIVTDNGTEFTNQLIAVCKGL